MQAATGAPASDEFAPGATTVKDLPALLNQLLAPTASAVASTNTRPVAQFSFIFGVLVVS